MKLTKPAMARMARSSQLISVLGGRRILVPWSARCARFIDALPAADPGVFCGPLKVTTMARTTVFGLLCVLLVFCTATAGDYGLTIDNTLEGPCRNSEPHSNNTCTAAAALADLGSHHRDGSPLKVASVKIGLAQCSVWFRGPDERTEFYSGLAHLLAQPSVFEEKELLHSVGCFPFKSMRRALENELANASLGPEARRRLSLAHSDVVKRYRN